MTKLVLSINMNGDDTDIQISTQQVGVPDFREWSLVQYFRTYLFDEIKRIKQSEKQGEEK